VARVSARVDWENKASRREMLFCLLEYLELALDEKQMSVEQFCAIGDKTISLVIKLGRVWGARINESGYRDNWRSIKQYHREETTSSA